jgi:hypothetical protein
MGFLDLFEKDREISGRFQPNEGTKLPGYYDPHQQEILIGGTIVVVAVTLLIATFRYRIYLRGSIIIVLAGLVTLWRKAAKKARLFWREVEDKANGPL